MLHIAQQGDKNSHVLARYERMARRLQLKGKGVLAPPSPDDWEIWYPALITEIVKLHNQIEALQQRPSREFVLTLIKQVLHQLFEKVAEPVKERIKYTWSQWFSDPDFDLNKLLDKPDDEETT